MCKLSTGGRLDWGFFDHNTVIDYTNSETLAIILACTASICYIIPIWIFFWVCYSWTHGCLVIILWCISVLVGWLYFFDSSTLWPQYHGSFFCFLAAFLTLLSIPTIVRFPNKKIEIVLDIVFIGGILLLFGEYWYYGKFTCLNKIT
jgi:hypothetical protein